MEYTRNQVFAMAVLLTHRRQQLYFKCREHSVKPQMLQKSIEYESMLKQEALSIIENGPCMLPTTRIIQEFIDYIKK